MKDESKPSGPVSESGHVNVAFEKETACPSAGTSSGRNDNDEVEEVEPLPFHRLFRFASRREKWMIATAVLFAVLFSFCIPVSIILFGILVDAFVQYDSNTSTDGPRCNTTLNISTIINKESEASQLENALVEFSIGTAATGIVGLFCNFVYITCFNYASEGQVHRIRSLFLKAALRQEVAWYDLKNSNDFTTQVAESLNKIQDGIGEKVGIFITFMGTGTISMAAAFLYGWELTLVIMATIPVMSISTAIVTRIQARLTSREIQIYSQAGGIAEEVLAAVRTVVVFRGQAKEIQRYQDSLEPAKTVAIRRGIASGIGSGIIWFINYATFALAFWYGIQLVLDSCESNSGYSSASLNIVFFNALYSSYKIGQALPLLESFTTARAAASSIFKVIDRIPQIDSSSKEGLRPETIRGHIRFENVHFNYPSRPEATILRGVSFQVEAGQTVALVGASGCGKSTCVQLIQRFYDPDHGLVEIDGMEVPSLNVRWLRSKISMVGQEPVLFATTIGQNILYGCEGASQEQVERAARLANAHDFIMKLPDKYDTMVGERGAQLSGGQKQRIAIARALIGNPRILLLDEATSALDTKSEATVQKALDQARQGRTTLIVAHRLTTIRNADRILVFKNGMVEEQGTHKELISLGRLYYNLVHSQTTDRISIGSELPTDVPSYQLVGDDATEVTTSEEVEQVQCSSRSDKWDDKEEDGKEVSLLRILQLSRSDWGYITAGILGSIVVGLTNPVYAVVFGEVQGLLSIADEELVRRQANLLSFLFLAIAGAAGISHFLENFMFALAGERLTHRLRVLTFSAMLRQEIGWFDRDENSVGSLCTRLSGDASRVQGANTRLGTIVEVAVSMSFSVVLALYIDWRLGLVAAVFVPLIVGASVLQTNIESGANAKQMRALEKSAGIAAETLSNIRTVASLCSEERFHELYMASLEEPHNAVKKLAPVRGFLYGLSVNMVLFASIACYHYGGYLVLTDGLPYKGVLKVGEALVFGFEFVAKTLAYTANFGKAKMAIQRIFRVLDRKPLMDESSSPPAEVGNSTVVLGKTEFENVHFKYPTRTDVTILNGTSFIAQPGETVALVGPSGSGKSTCIHLLQRFYDPNYGHIHIDGHPIDQLSLSTLRSHLSIVSQEPMLFNRSIVENIAYGDNSRKDIAIEEIIEAAKMANIHTFIQSLSLGYETNVGLRGTQLSGGQKQRVAIARALIRNPKILLLDEATSALDSESERIVQDALDQARQGRTCITIAHRLSTIQNADRIIVMKQGRIEEQGTHSQLLQSNGLYRQMWNLQNLNN